MVNDEADKLAHGPSPTESSPEPGPTAPSPTEPSPTFDPEAGKEGDPEADEAEADVDRGFKVYDRRFWTMDDQELEAADKAPKAPSYIEELESQVAEKDRQLREYIAAYKKEVVEELEQTKRRLEADAAQQRRQTIAQVATPMFDVLEALERSIPAAEQSAGVEAVLQGVKMVQKLMLQKLQEIGLERIETDGRPFDPAIHEAVAVAPVDDPARDGLVTAELGAGFTFDGRTFRAAKVQVGKVPR